MTGSSNAGSGGIWRNENARYGWKLERRFWTRKEKGTTTPAMDGSLNAGSGGTRRNENARYGWKLERRLWTRNEKGSTTSAHDATGDSMGRERKGEASRLETSHGGKGTLPEIRTQLSRDASHSILANNAGSTRLKARRSETPTAHPKTSLTPARPGEELEHRRMSSTPFGRDGRRR